MGVGRLEGGRQRCVEIIKPVDLWPFHEFARYLLGSSVVPLVFSSVSDIRRIRRLKPISLSTPESSESRGRRSTIHSFPSPSPDPFRSGHPLSLSLSLSLFRPLRTILPLTLPAPSPTLLRSPPPPPPSPLLPLPTSLFRLLYCLEPLHRGCIPFPGLIET